MARVPPKKPIKLAKKLLTIRLNLNMSQNELIRSMRLEGVLTQSQVSAFERGSRVPSLVIVLRYARLYGVSSDELIDDNLKLR